MILSYENCERVLTKCFLKEWENLSPVIFKNQSPEWINKNTDAWVRYSILRTARQQSSLGAKYNRRFTQMGRVFVQCYVRNGIKTSLLNKLSDRVVQIYEDTYFPNWMLLNITQTDSPDGADYRRSEIADGAWFNSLVKVQFMFDEIK